MTAKMTVRDAQSVSLALSPAVAIPGSMSVMHDADTSTLFAKCSTIEARMSEKTSLMDLVGLTEKYCMTDAWRVLVFWACAIELFHMLDMPELADMADARYTQAKWVFCTDPSALTWESVKSELAAIPEIVA